MGVNNKQRRAAKAKRRARQRARSGHEHHGHRRTEGGAAHDEPTFTTSELVRGLLELAATRTLAGDTEFAASVVGQLATIDRGDVEREAEGMLMTVVGQLWDHGWQPAELVRQARRTNARTGRLLATVVAADHHQRAADTLHPRWASQLDSLSLPHLHAATGWLRPFAVVEGLDREAVVTTVIDALVVCFGVGPLPTIVPPPGSASTSDGAWAAAAYDSGADDPVLVKVRALLAQAESTTFEAEAEAFTAKAQTLMARHSIDAALAWANTERRERPITVRIPIDDPYTDVKSLLLHVVAEHSRCRAVYHERYALASVVGFAGDVAATETLYTSLLVQSQVAVQAEGATAAPGARTRSRSFRSSFLMAYTHRVGDRLAAINAAVENETEGTDATTPTDGAGGDGGVLPVLAERDAVVDHEVETLFGELRSGRVRGTSDPLGWVRGEQAADRAQLSFADLDSTAG